MIRGPGGDQVERKVAGDCPLEINPAEGPVASDGSVLDPALAPLARGAWAVAQLNWLG